MYYFKEKNQLKYCHIVMLTSELELPLNMPRETEEHYLAIHCTSFSHGNSFLKTSLRMYPSLPLLTGCSAKLPFCKSNPCQNGGTCRVSWETFSCDCPLGYGGKDCSHGERLHEFIYIIWFYTSWQCHICSIALF